MMEIEGDGLRYVLWLARLAHTPPVTFKEANMKKVRFLLFVLLPLCALCLGLGSCNRSYVDADGLRYTPTEDGEGYVVSATDDVTAEDLVIPATYKEKPVVKISGSGFEEQESIISVTIPASVQAIGPHAFYGCGRLETVRFAENSALVSIGSYAFSECHALSAFTVPASLETWERGAFQHCSSLKSVRFEEQSKLEVLGDYAFFECKGLESITLATDGALRYIDANAFAGCESLTSVTIPASVEEIGRRAFYKCTALQELWLEGATGLTAIWDEAFARCESLSSLTLPNRGITLHRAAFSYCKSLTAVTVPHEESFLHAGVFEGCESLASLTIPYVGRGKWSSGDEAVLGYLFHMRQWDEQNENLNKYVPDSLKMVVITHSTRVFDGAFWQCDGITDLYLPDSVTELGSFAFSSCESLIAIHFGGTMEQWSRIEKRLGWSGGCPSELTVYCIDGERLARD